MITYRRKKYGVTFYVIMGVIVLVVAPMLIVNSYQARKAKQEFRRMNAVKLVVEQKVEAYHQATGHYPDSIAVLSFTNSPQEIEMASDLRKIRYRRTADSYAVGWDSAYGYSR